MICEFEFEMSGKPESKTFWDLNVEGIWPQGYKNANEFATRGKNNCGVGQTPLTKRGQERADADQKRDPISKEKLI